MVDLMCPNHARQLLRGFVFDKYYDAISPVSRSVSRMLPE